MSDGAAEWAPIDAWALRDSNIGASVRGGVCSELSSAAV